MPLNFPIGKTSNDTLVVKDVTSLPHLFVSVSNARQLQILLQQVIQQIAHWQLTNKVQLAIALNNTNNTIDNAIIAQALHTMLYNQEEAQMSSSKDAFVTGLYKEMLDRFRQRKKAKNKSINFPYLIVVIDELFHLVLTRKKQTGLYFLQLLILGHEVNIHIIAASASTYRNLLIQLVHLHPGIEQQLNSNKLLGGRAIIKPLGAEMVVTPDSLIFFKTIDTPIYERYFPIL
ncbi:hypothetical protein ACFOW1_09780 [Parasediminibacterium paludis]|uniref:FtsK domain-containing protein n=1 Tax=Parasediminibacterium paludis TaxID=908966 RepID=A0ABV8PZT3_9BACT